MPFALFQPKPSSTHPNELGEERLANVKFGIHKFNSRPRPKDKRRTLIIGCFSEFGCETVAVMYCLPRIIRRLPGLYLVAAGWYGREYLYRHLVDEFWELDEQYMFLRDRTFAFHNRSVNIDAIEKRLRDHGTVVPTSIMGRFAVGNTCKTCGYFWDNWVSPARHCPACKSTVIVPSMFSDPTEYRPTVTRVPRPRPEVLQWAKNLLGERPVGVFARGRATYGRNLTPQFYIDLIQDLERQGYSPVWLGEKQSSLPCPVSHILDFSNHPEARDLEKTLAIICNCEFTIQFWTASSRLAAMMGVPFILIESPEQIYCSGYSPGQEGRRLDLMNFGPRKVVLAHYLNAANDLPNLLLYVDQAISELRAGNTADLITNLVDDPEATAKLQHDHQEMNI